MPAASRPAAPCPRERDLPSALRKSAPGDTRVVCEGTAPKSPKKKIKKLKKKLEGKKLKKKIKKLRKRYRKKLNANPSIKALNASIKDARVNGYKLRASQPPLVLTNHDAKRLRKANVKLLRLCAYHEIQPAVTDSHNNDRVVIMPGLYTEPTSRASADQRPKPARSTRSPTTAAAPGALSYAYQVALPQRPEPDRGDRPRDRDRQGPPQPPRAGPPRHPRTPAPASAATSRSRARASAPTTSSSTAARVASGNGGADRRGQGRRHPRRPRRRLRAAQRHGPPRQRARHLRARVRRLPARPLQGLLRRRVRGADLRRGPRR